MRSIFRFARLVFPLCDDLPLQEGVDVVVAVFPREVDEDTGARLARARPAEAAVADAPARRAFPHLSTHKHTIQISKERRKKHSTIRALRGSTLSIVAPNDWGREATSDVKQ